MANKTNGEPKTTEEAQALEGLESGLPIPAPGFDREEIDVQIATARRYPRSVVAFKRTALEMATIDEETAGSMFYRLKRGGTVIEGPSIRLAEVSTSAWGNIRWGSRVIAIGEKFVRAQGVCHDLERNVWHSAEVSRRITDKTGKRYGDDMIQVTANAACALAKRNAAFGVIPLSYVKDIMAQAQQVALGKALTMEQRRERILAWFAKVGAKSEQVLRIVGRKGPEDLTVDDLVTLHGIGTAIKDGETTLEQVLKDTEPAAAEPKPAGPSTLDKLTEQMAMPGTEPAKEPKA